MGYIGKQPASAPLTSSDIADGIISEAKIGANAVTTGKIADGTISSSDTDGSIGSPAFKNLIINGDMSQAQRGTSTSSVSSGSTFPTDRFKFMPNALGTFTISQSTTVPSGQGFAKSIKVDCTTANASPGDGSTLQLVQYMEGQMLQHLKKGTSSAESVTISFWVRSNKTGTYTLELYDNDNTRQISQTYTISSADTWEKKTLTFAGDTSGALGNDNGLSFAVQFWLATGANYNNQTLSTSWSSVTQASRVSSSQVNIADNTANEWYITGLQMEVGTTASDFEFVPFDVNFQRCRRYFQFIGSVVGTSDSSSNWRGIAPLNPEMRASPSISLTGNYEITDGYSADFTSSDSTSINLINNTGSTKRIFPQIQSFSGLTEGRTYFSPRYHTNDEYIEADAEL
jgi:hypothetical protein